jgi:lipoyl(octanoyl) transferase
MRGGTKNSRANRKLIFSELILIDDRAPRVAALNMAIDETLLHRTCTPLLRFYRWREPSVSFGYFGRFDEARQFALDRTLVRRWTGGGVVPHGDDLTYSLIIPATNPVFQFSSGEVYRAVHEAIACSLRSIGIQTCLASKAAPKITDSCFANPVVSDVLEGERKIAGAAQRKTRAGLLHQGSIQRGDLDGQFRNELTKALSRSSSTGEISAAVIDVAEKLARKKYAGEWWLRRR